MSQKNVALILMAIGTALAGPEVVSHIKKDVASQSAEISAPHVAEVGELIRIYYPAGTIEWDIPVTDYTISPDGRTVHVSFRAEGTYEIIAAATVGTRVEIRRHKIVIGKGANPDDPDPAPTPPEPEPSDGFADKVYGWCVEYKAPHDKIGKLADNFDKALEDSTTVEDLLKNTAALNRKADIKGCESVLGNVQQMLFDEMSSEPFESHAKVWTSISNGMRKYSDEKPITTEIF